MSFPRYSEYKGSGAEWLGEVPAHWRLAPIWTLFARKKTVGHSDEELLSVYRDYGVIKKASRDDNFNKPSDDLSAYQLVEPGDLVINKMKAWQGSVGVSEFRGIVSPAYFVYKARHCEQSKYLHYLFRTDHYTAGYLSLSKGIRVNQWDLEPQYHSRMPALLPSLDEQQQISAFLDKETLKIDGLIAEQERLIALLKEKRQAVISHAVTKGLDPNVPMKDSNIEWLGKVPAHWEITRLKYATDIIVDCPHETPIYNDEGEYLVIRTADIDDGAIDQGGMYRVREDQYLNRTRRQVLLEKDIVYGREGERWGHAALVPASEKYCLGQRMMQFRASGSVNPVFLMWQLNSLNVYRQGEVDTVGATSPHVNVGTIRNFGLTSPPRDEQDAISSYLDEQYRLINTLIVEAEKAIALLSEHRSALISAAVTGKIDVRQLAAAEAA